MTLTVSNFTTGPSTLPDVGVLSYNGCIFSPLFETKVSSNVVKDNARRTVKEIEHTIVVDGYVTAPHTDVDALHAIDVTATMATLYRLLTAQGGALTYKGRGLDIVVNARGAGGGGGGIFANPGKPPAGVISATDDVAWGPIPEMIEFQPLGGGQSAKIVWKVTTRLVPPAVAKVQGSRGLLQLNYETSVSYAEDGYSKLSIKGTTEIPLTRSPDQTSRKVTVTADSYRSVIEERVLSGIDLGKFRIVNRNFDVSRDKRTIEWNVEAEEKPYMDNPPYCTVAHGSFNVRPAKAGPGLAVWLCSLRATYTVRADYARKNAWWAFLLLLRLRMLQSKNTPIPADDVKPKKGGIGIIDFLPLPPGVGPAINEAKQQIEVEKRRKDISRRAWLIDFTIDEGLYRDSKTISFGATWRLTTNFWDILIASGLWKKTFEGKRTAGDNMWAMSIADVMGSKSWMPNQLNPALDVIVDFGSTGV